MRSGKWRENFSGQGVTTTKTRAAKFGVCHCILKDLPEVGRIPSKRGSDRWPSQAFVLFVSICTNPSRAFLEIWTATSSVARLAETSISQSWLGKISLIPISQWARDSLQSSDRGSLIEFKPPKVRRHRNGQYCMLTSWKSSFRMGVQVQRQLNRRSICCPTLAVKFRKMAIPFLPCHVTYMRSLVHRTLPQQAC